MKQIIIIAVKAIADFFRSMFAEKGEVSTMRVLAFEIVTVALAIAIIAVILQDLTVDVISLVLGLITIALTGKVRQKRVEGDSTSEIESGPPEKTS